MWGRLREGKFVLLLLIALPGCAKAVAQDKVVATVNGTPITEAQFHAALIERMGVAGLQQMIDEKLLEQAARRYGVRVSNKEVDDALKQRRQLATSERDFEEQWRLLGLSSEADYRKHLKRDLLIDKITAKQVKVSEAELRGYYDAHKSDFMEPERVQVRDILLNDPQVAKELLKALRNPQSDFAGLAKQFSEDPTTRDKGGDRGLERLSDFARPLADAIKKLKPGDISDVIDNQGEWHILKLEKRIPARQKSFAEVREDVSRLVTQRKREQLKQNLMRQLYAEAKVEINDPRLRAAFPSKQ